MRALFLSPFFVLVVMLFVKSQALAQQYVELWPGSKEINLQTCFDNDQVLAFDQGMLYSRIDVDPITPGELGYFCFMGALGPGFIGVFTVKVASGADKFRAGAIEVVDEARCSYLGTKRMNDGLVKNSGARQGRMLIISPDHSKPRRFALVMSYSGERHGSAVVSFHAVNPIWESMMAGGETILLESLSQEVAKGMGATGMEADVVAGLTQLVIGSVMSGKSDDSTDFIVGGLAEIVPHLSQKIPTMAPAWLAKTYLNIRAATYKGFDRRYRLEPR